MPATNRHSGSFGPSGEIPVPGYSAAGRERGGGAGGNGGGGGGGGGAAGRQGQFDIAQSPPNNVSNKNTKHVPCKFFRQGACQAGNACPFSHSLDPMMHQAPCKYFMKGNCKFGAKCALAHYLPNGHRVSRADLDASLAINNRSNYNSNTRGEGGQFAAQEGPFFEQYMQQSPFPNPDYSSGQDQFPLLDDDNDAYNDRYNQYTPASQFDTNLNSPPTSQFGSPPNDGGMYRPNAENNFRSALNAPLPASFDANSLPHIARYGPFGQSVPDKFGMRSPPTSALTRKLGSPPDAGNNPKLSSIGSALRNVSSPLSVSPQLNDELSGPKTMHSQKSSRPRMISASLPRTSLYDWDEGLGVETDLLPNSLHDEVLLPQEKMRRLSRPEPELSTSAREKSNGLNIPGRPSNTFGSPPTGSSPSRFRNLFEGQRKKEEAATGMANSNQNFGHVGSPLRESWMPSETTEPARGVQISGISQAMARMELNQVESTDFNGSARQLPGFRGGSNFGRFDRTISSPGLHGKKIDEEGEGGFFEMDDENSKRNSANWGLSIPSTSTNDDRSQDETTQPNGSKSIPIFGFRS